MRAQHWDDQADIVPSGLEVAGTPLLADPSGALFHEGEGALLVADLHLEKGSSFARHGMLLPPYDTDATLSALAGVVARYAPRIVIALGDSFHDRVGADRLSPTNRTALAALQRGRDWLWLTGNHDPEPQAGAGGRAATTLRLGALTLRHEPAGIAASAGEIAAHLHPVARVLGTGGTTRRRCFVTDGRRCVMPAFGAYAGGLNIRHAAFAGLWGERPITIHALGRDRVYRIPVGACVPDGFGSLTQHTPLARGRRARAPKPLA